jgi:hypothetical protein
MPKEIQRFFQELWNQLKKALADQCGNFPLRDSKAEDHSVEVIERALFRA